MLPSGALFSRALLAWLIDRWRQTFDRPRPRMHRAAQRPDRYVGATGPRIDIRHNRVVDERARSNVRRV
jgi:hypothetical protein